MTILRVENNKPLATRPSCDLPVMGYNLKNARNGKKKRVEIIKIAKFEVPGIK